MMLVPVAQIGLEVLNRAEGRQAEEGADNDPQSNQQGDVEVHVEDLALTELIFQVGRNGLDVVEDVHQAGDEEDDAEVGMQRHPFMFGNPQRRPISGTRPARGQIGADAGEYQRNERQ